MNKDQVNWFEPNADASKDFAERARTCIDEAHIQIAEATKCNDEVQPSDGVSNASLSSH